MPRNSNNPPQKKGKQSLPPADSRGRKRSAANGRRPRSPEDRAAARAAFVHSRSIPKRRSIQIMLVTGMIFLIVLAYIFDSVTKLGNRESIVSESIQMGQMDVPILYSGIIIRSESVYTAPIAGVVSYSHNDLERVNNGVEICRIEDGVVSEAAAGKVEDIEKAILRIQERRSDISAFKKDLDNIYLQIKNVVDSRALTALQTDFSDVYEVKETITSNINLRNQIIMNEDRGSLSTLVGERQHYENELNINSSFVYAQESGVLSYVVDGLERSLTPERLNNLTPEETRMSVDYSQNMRIRDVEEGDDVFKVLSSNEWYIAAYIPMEHVHDWAKGQFKMIYIQQGWDYSAIDMQVEAITKGDIDYYIVLRTTKNIIDYIHMRDVKFKIADGQHSGYKIPTSAIMDHTLLKVPKEYMIVDSGNYLIKDTEYGDEKISVRSQYSDSDYYYIFQEIGKIVLGDRIKRLEEPVTILTLSDVQNVQGVYVVNRGYAEFKRITLEPQIPLSGEYVILNPMHNPELRLHDRISSDAGKISPQQKIVD